MPHKLASRNVRNWGYTQIVIAVIGFGGDFFWRASYGSPLPVPISMGVVVANLSMALAGIVTIAIAKAIAELEKRLDAFENSR